MNPYAVFFNFDRTLIRGDSQAGELIHCIRHEAYLRKYPGRTLFPIVTVLGVWARLIPQRRYNEIFTGIYRGMTERMLTQRGDMLFSRYIRTQFLPQVLSLIESHRTAGAIVVIVSATACHIIRPVHRHICSDYFFCTHLEMDRDGRATGRPQEEICIGRDKRDAITTLAVEYGLNLDLSYAYSDHHADLPLLEARQIPGQADRHQ